MRLQDFMHYPDIGFHLAMVRCYEWSGRKVPLVQQTLIKRLWFIFGALNLIYQNVGMAIYLLVSEPPEQQLADYVQLISETCSVMSLTLVGASNMWMLLQHRSNIEAMIDELQQLFPQRGKQMRKYRLHHYHVRSSRLMKYIAIFFMFAFVFYNTLPFVELVYELLAESQHFQYKYQSNTWYPWQLWLPQDSIASFVAAYLCQVISSLIGVAFIMATQFLLCFFVTQMQLHFDWLASALLSLDATQPDANVQLKALIAYHSRLLCIADHINRIFNFSFLINFITSALAICLIGFAMVMISMASTFKYSVGFVGFLIMTLFICYNGTQFTSANDKLMNAAFHGNWYNGDLAYRKMLLFFMMSSCKSQVLRIYKFTPVSMETYMAILKFSYQMFTFVNALI